MSNLTKIMLLFILLATGGCRGDDMLTAEEVNALLAEQSYKPIKLNASSNFPHKERPWVCLCTSPDESEEFIVVVSTSGNLTETKLGIDGVLTYDELRSSLSREGILSDVIDLDLFNLNPDIANDMPLHWYYFDVSENIIYRFNLDGTFISKTSFNPGAV